MYNIYIVYNTHHILYYSAYLLLKKSVFSVFYLSTLEVWNLSCNVGQSRDNTGDSTSKCNSPNIILIFQKLWVFFTIVPSNKFFILKKYPDQILRFTSSFLNMNNL